MIKMKKEQFFPTVQSGYTTIHMLGQRELGYPTTRRRLEVAAFPVAVTGKTGKATVAYSSTDCDFQLFHTIPVNCLKHRPKLLKSS